MASRYSSGAACNSSTVLTTMGPLMGVSSNERVGIEGLEIGGEVGEFVRKLGAEILGERGRRARFEASDGSRLAEQEHLAAAHAQQLPGDALAGRRAERGHQVGDVVRADLERALLIGLLRLVGG